MEIESRISLDPAMIARDRNLQPAMRSRRFTTQRDGRCAALRRGYIFPLTFKYINTLIAALIPIDCARA